MQAPASYTGDTKEEAAGISQSARGAGLGQVNPTATPTATAAVDGARAAVRLAPGGGRRCSARGRLEGKVARTKAPQRRALALCGKAGLIRYDDRGRSESVV